MLPAGATVAGRGSHPLGIGALPRRTEICGLVPVVRERMQRIRFLTAVAVGSLVTENLEGDPRYRSKGAVDEHAVHQDHRQTERFRRVEDGQHRAAGDLKIARVRAAALDLDESKATRIRVPVLDVVATVFGGYADRLESEVRTQPAVASLAASRPDHVLVGGVKLVVDPSGGHRVDPDVAVATHGFSAMEGRVTVLLAEGMNMHETEAAMGRREGTIRTHVKRWNYRDPRSAMEAAFRACKKAASYKECGGGEGHRVQQAARYWTLSASRRSQWNSNRKGLRNERRQDKPSRRPRSATYVLMHAFSGLRNASSDVNARWEQQCPRRLCSSLRSIAVTHSSSVPNFTTLPKGESSCQ